MKILVFVFLFIQSYSYTQSFQMQYNKISANEIQLTTTYNGPKAEISIPRRGRVTYTSDQASVQLGNIVSVGSNNDTTQEYSAKFTYSLILPNQGGFGSISDNWYPTIKDMPAEYTISSPIAGNMFAYPYNSNEDNSFSFTDDMNPKLAIITHSRQQEFAGIPVSIFAANTWSVSGDEISALYKYIQDHFGAKSLREIIIVNSTLASDNSFILKDKLYLNISGRGTAQQIKDAIADAWGSEYKEFISPRLFNLFKDTIYRLSPFTPVTVAQQANTNEEITNSSTSTPTSQDIQLGTIVLNPPTSYYKALIQQGFPKNEVVNVNADGLFNNYALLHMAQYNIKPESLIAGLKAYFNNIGKPNTNSQTNVSNSESTNTKKSKSDTDSIDWSIITQNELQEPLFSLYTKEVLIEKSQLPSLVATSNLVTRNSQYIPDLTIVDENNNPQEIKWNDSRYASIRIKQGNYRLDINRNIPQQSFINNFYTFDTNEQTIRNQILYMSERNKVTGEINLRKHMDLLNFPVTTDNGLNIPRGTMAYVVISHILANNTGALKPAIKESFFYVDNDNKIHLVNTRLRI